MRKRYRAFDPRQHMQRPDFEIFHSRDPQPPDVDMHHHDFYEVYFFLSGKVGYRVEGRIYHLEPGDLLLISPSELHQPVPGEEEAAYERVVLWIDRSYLERAANGSDSLTRCFDNARASHTNLLRLTHAQRTEIMTRLDALVQEQQSRGYASELYATSLLMQLLVELNRMALEPDARRAGQEETTALVSEVLAYIGEHYYENLSLDGLAQRFYVSKYHLSHEFSREVGISVYRYITLKRLLVAKQMLASGISPGVAYANCGFSDYANFYRAFKARYGAAPRDCMGSTT